MNQTLNHAEKRVSLTWQDPEELGSLREIDHYVLQWGNVTYGVKTDIPVFSAVEDNMTVRHNVSEKRKFHLVASWRVFSLGTVSER